MAPVPAIAKAASRSKDKICADTTDEQKGKNSAMGGLKDPGTQTEYETYKSAILKALQNGACVDTQNVVGLTPMHYAAIFDDAAFIRTLFNDYGADINSKSNPDGNTPLDYAAIREHVKTAKTLIELRADVLVENNDGVTALEFAKASANPNNPVIDLIEAELSDTKEGEETKCPENTGIELTQDEIDNMFDAIDTQDLETVKSYVNTNNQKCLSLVNAKRDDGWTVLHSVTLHSATYSGNLKIVENLKIVQYLVEKGADVDAERDNGHTVLHTAALSGNLDVVQYLVEQGADVDAKRDDGWTGLHMAAYSGTLDIVKYLVNEQGANVDAKTDDGWTVLHSAAYSGKLDIVKYLVETKQMDPNLELRDGRKPSELAPEGVVRDYLQEKETIAQPDTKEGEETKCPENTGDDLTQIEIDKMFEVGKEDLETVKSYVNENNQKCLSLVNAKRMDAWTVLHYAAYSGKLDVVKYLVEQGADVDAKTVVGWTVLHDAAYSGTLDIVKYLVEQGANVDAKNNVGWTPLHAAASSGKLDVVKYLVDEQGADVDAKNNDGWTVLHAAAYYGTLDIVQYLVEQGADVDAERNDGYTVLHSAAASGKLDIVKYLVETKKMDPNLELPDGTKPSELAPEGVVRDYLQEKETIAQTDTKEGNETKCPENTFIQLAPKEIDEMFDAVDTQDLETVKSYVNKNNQKCLSLVNATVNTSTGKYTVLHEATYSEKLDIVQYLVEKGANVDAKRDDGWTVLHSAVAYGTLDIIKYLVEQGADVDAKDNDGYTVLHAAAASGKLDIVKYLVDEQNADVDAVFNGRKPSELGHSEDVRDYLQGKENPN
jgi:ankyrin repeat protein